MAQVMTRRTKFVLDEDRIPRAWYNIAADLPVAAVARTSTRRPLEPIGPADLAPLFPMALIVQEVSQDREIEIPDPVREAYAPLPAQPALPGPPPREGARYAGPHLLQVRGRAARPAATSRTPRSPRRSTTRRRASPGSRPRPGPASGAAPWRSPAPYFGLDVKVYMVRASYDQKPYRRILMETYGVRGRRRAPHRRPTTAGRSSRRRPTTRARSASRSARRSRTPRPATTRSTRSARCWTTSCSTRR